MKTEEMRQVMKVMHHFSENEKNYLLYQSRLDAASKESTIISAYEEERRLKEKAEEQAAKAEEQAVKAAKEKEQIQKQFNDLLLFLEKKGIKPDEQLKSGGQ